MKPSSMVPIEPARQPLHLHRGVGHDGADLHAVASRDGAVGHAEDAVDVHHAVVLGIGAQARAALHHEVQRPVELLAREPRVGRCAPHLVEHLVDPKPPSGRGSAAKPPPRATVTRCCTSTSSGLSGVQRDSTWPASAARRAATASTSSSVLVGTRVTRLGRPGAWPLRPARCSSRATPLALPICSTRSTGRKSTPRSRDEVATTAFSRPSLRPSSTHSRSPLSSEPWCSATMPAQSGRASRISWYQIRPASARW